MRRRVISTVKIKNPFVYRGELNPQSHPYGCHRGPQRNILSLRRRNTQTVGINSVTDIPITQPPQSHIFITNTAILGASQCSWTYVTPPRNLSRLAYKKDPFLIMILNETWHLLFQSPVSRTIMGLSASRFHNPSTY
ncbi:hypothetical protein TNCV_766291 [Trichonephila clavipes]|nr:hypothetical protein TNCV_766291 [Trichonephila clavipes]